MDTEKLQKYKIAYELCLKLFKTNQSKVTKPDKK